MTGNENRVQVLFDEMLHKGLVSSGRAWIERAIEARNTQLAIGVAYSRVLTYDRIDRVLINLVKAN
jgi:hypothetical protein